MVVSQTIPPRQSLACVDMSVTRPSVTPTVLHLPPAPALTPSPNPSAKFACPMSVTVFSSPCNGYLKSVPLPIGAPGFPVPLPYFYVWSEVEEYIVRRHPSGSRNRQSINAVRRSMMGSVGPRLWPANKRETAVCYNTVKTDRAGQSKGL